MVTESGKLARGVAIAAVLSLALGIATPAATAAPKKRTAKAVQLTEPFGSFTPAAASSGWSASHILIRAALLAP